MSDFGEHVVFADTSLNLGTFNQQKNNQAQQC